MPQIPCIIMASHCSCRFSQIEIIVLFVKCLEEKKVASRIVGTKETSHSINVLVVCGCKSLGWRFFPR